VVKNGQEWSRVVKQNEGIWLELDGDLDAGRMELEAWKGRELTYIGARRTKQRRMMMRGPYVDTESMPPCMLQVSQNGDTM